MDAIATEPKKLLAISHVSDPDEMIALWPKIKSVDTIEGSPAALLAKCLLGKCVILKGLVGDSLEAILIYEYDSSGNMIVQLLNAPRHMLTFEKEFYNLCKRLGVKQFFFASKLDGRLFSRLLGVHKLHSWFSVEVS